MDSPFARLYRVALAASVLLACATAHLPAAEVSSAQVQEILDQNRRLQEQVRSQQTTIDALSAQVRDVLRASERHERALDDLRSSDRGSAPAVSGNREQEVRISGETGIAFFRTGPAGQYPNSEFRVDDAKLFVEAPLIKDVYFFGGLDISVREINDEFFHLGELYIDFENVSRLWGRRSQMSVRAGRINIPFGTEYMKRGPVDNPLISHSITDFWGIDEGVEIYGSLAGLQYILAVQNGGHKTMHDFDKDKSVTARLTFDPAPAISLNVSAMRTGKINVAGDSLTELWFGNGFFRSIGNAANTRTFRVNLLQAEGTARWRTGHFTGAAGFARYDDDDSGADNARHTRFYTLELVQNFSEKAYAAARYGSIRTPKGYPLVGWGDFGTFLFRSSLTEELTRLSLGLGYRLGPPVVMKLEYTVEDGRMMNRVARDNHDLIASELGVKF